MDLEEFVTKSAEAYKKMREDNVGGQQRGEFSFQVLKYIDAHTTNTEERISYMNKYYEMRK